MSPRTANYDDRLKDYVDVKERIALFYAAHPDGRLVTDRVELWTDDDVPRIVVKALAYRTADDPHPGTGWSWMVLPGTTPYTKGSEIENAETSAWGRAIGSLGIGISASIASADEVASKAGEERRTYEAQERTDDGGLIGTVAIGKPPVDMAVRQTPDGSAYGFKLAQGRKGFQALAVGPLADVLAVAGLEVGTRVVVWGRIEEVPWQKDGKDMPPFSRIAIERVQTPDWDVPAPERASESPAAPEAVPEPLPWDPAESARLDAEEVA